MMLTQYCVSVLLYLLKRGRPRLGVAGALREVVGRGLAPQNPVQVPAAKLPLIFRDLRQVDLWGED